MGRGHSERYLGAVVLLVAACLLAGAGLSVSGDAAAETRRRGLRDVDMELNEALAVAEERLRLMLRRSRGGTLPDPGIPHDLISARYRRPAPRSPSPWADAERAEFVEASPEKALSLYQQRLQGDDLDPTWRAEGLRNVARLARAANAPARARSALEDAEQVAGADDLSRLLVAYDGARAREGEDGRLRLQGVLARGGYPGAPPDVRLSLFERLGGMLQDAPELQALAAALRSPADESRLHALSDGRVAWLLVGEGAEYRFAVAEGHDVLLSVLPGMRAGRWRRSAQGGRPLPSPPFAGGALMPAETTLAEVDAAASQRRWSLLAPALILAACLGFLAWVFVRDGKRRRALREQREAFLLSAAHELKTPITNVRLYAETLASDARNEPDAVEQFARIIESEALRLDRRVHDMLMLAAGDERDRPVQVAFDPVPVVERVVEQVRAAGPNDMLRLESEIESGVRARGSKPLLSSAVEAVIDNALKFAGAGPVEVEVGTEQASVVVRVSDRGPGIPKSDLKRVFDPFVRLARDVSAATPGTGLGLALARRCARICGGDATAEARQGGGVQVCIRLPRAPRGGKGAA